jgi:hypothetical protein
MLGVLAVAALFSVPGLFAQDEDDDAAQMALLKEISAKQDPIQQTLDEVKSEVQMVKVRVSSR